eukprot:4926335-Amphidinium_carterae.1
MSGFEISSKNHLGAVNRGEAMLLGLQIMHLLCGVTLRMGRHTCGTSIRLLGGAQGGDVFPGRMYNHVLHPQPALKVSMFFHNPLVYDQGTHSTTLRCLSLPFVTLQRLALASIALHYITPP